MKKQIVYLLGMLLIFAITLTPLVLAGEQDVTTTWIIPGDTTISVSYPNSETKITFEPSSGTFDDQKAKAQTSSLAALRVSNDGNTALEIRGRWTTDWATGATYVNMSIEDDTNASHLSYGDTNETVNQTWVASLAVSDTEDFWFWADGTDMAETAGVDRTLRVYSVNV